MSDVKNQLQQIFRDIFEDDSIIIFDEMTGDDIEEWDSLEHINLIIAVEKNFNIQFATSEISRLKDADQNVGKFIKLIEQKIC
ncbi:MAG: acyl carrier protein [Spirochaetota bacterium]|nr:acyl carrier protein [Spirochaetota bacterium]